MFRRKTKGLSLQFLVLIPMSLFFDRMNLFARGVGGFISDHVNAVYGMKGRLYVQAVMLIFEGALVLIFANTSSLAGGIVTLVCFSLFVQAAEGSTYGIVPYVDKNYIGAVTGVVGAGGNAGAVIFSLFFREMEYHDAFLWMGVAVITSSVLTSLLLIQGESAMLGGTNNAMVEEVEYMEEAEALKKMEDHSNH